MEMFLGVKIIQAREMSRAEYNAYRGWQLPADENGDDEGFLVEYMDGGKSNHAAHTGYISWSPKDVFDRAYRPTIGMTFGLAVEALKQGQRVARAGWNGKGMYLQYVDGADWDIFTINSGFPFRSFIAMKTVDDEIVPWLASQSDVLAEDWSLA
jgi:hypothetical protein